MRFRIDNKICTRVNGLVREASAQLEEPDYTKMYRAHRAQCCQTKDVNQPKEIAVCWEMVERREESLHNITTGEGKLLRVSRSIQVEEAFGQLKHNRQFKRFPTGGNCKVLAELYFLAFSQNIAKRISKCNSGKGKAHLLQPKALLKFKIMEIPKNKAPTPVRYLRR